MKIVRFSAGGRASYGVLANDRIRGLKGTPYAYFKGPRFAPAFSGEEHDAAEVKLLAPCLPSKIVALRLNYRSHAQETGFSLPAEPLIFLKPPTAVIGPEDNIVYPPSSKRVDYEGELGVVIGRRAKGVPKDGANGCILGYTCVNDVTARDLQKADKQRTRAKGFDTFAPIGPYIETELDPSDLQIETYLNGGRRQSARSSALIFSVAAVVSFVSNVMTLLPGDVIATGTPDGIGPMQPGDVVEVRIEGLGTLRNYVVAGS